MGMKKGWLWGTGKTSGPIYANKSWKLLNFLGKILSRILWGMNIVRLACPFIKRLIRERLGANLTVSRFIPFSWNRLPVWQLLRLCKSPLRHRTWRHRSSESRIGQFRAWSIWPWKPFVLTWSTIKVPAKLEWHDCFLKKTNKLKINLKINSKISIVSPTLNKTYKGTHTRKTL